MVPVSRKSSRFSNLMPRDGKMLLVSCLSVVTGMAFDFLTPLGVAAGVLYALFVLTAFWWQHTKTSFVFAAVATCLIGAGYWYINDIRVDLVIVQLNRALSIFVIWAAAFIIYAQKKMALSREVSEGNLQAVLASALDGIITIRDDGIVESYNAACGKMFGFTAEEVIGHNIKMLMPEPYQREHDTYLSNYRRTGIRKIIGIGREVRGQRRDGSTFPIDLSVTEVSTSGQRLFCGVVRDISKHKEAEQEREEMIQKLSRSNRDLDQFAYMASHDLKAPLRVIDNVSGWLEEDLADVMDPESAENLQLMRNRVARMERLLDDLLAYARIGQGEDVRYDQKIVGNKLIEEALLLTDVPEGFVINVDRKFAEIELHRMPLMQIFSNLLNNAVKHHDREDGTVTVSVQEEEGRYLFSVCDDGPGIDARFHGEVFEMFKRLKPRDRIEGSGLGLAIIEKLTQQFGEDISLRSAEGAGSTFSFRWPINQPDKSVVKEVAHRYLPG